MVVDWQTQKITLKAEKWRIAAYGFWSESFEM
jgi:hypothetical protein